MLRSLLSLLQKRIDQYDLIELYDNNFTRDQSDRLVLKILDGVIVANRLPAYQDLLINFTIPNYLK